MGFLSRTVSFMRYRVKGDVEGAFWESVREGIRKGAFKQVESSGDIIGIGWTSLEDFTADLSERESVIVGNYAAMAFRVDSVRVPPRILELHLKQETQRVLAETGRTRLSSGQRRELKEQVKESLKKRVFPSIQVYDLIWNTTEKAVWFGTLTVKAREMVEDHFKKSFGLSLIPLIPYLRAQELTAEDERSALLDDLTPSIFVP